MPGDADAVVLKAVNEAERALARLMGELRSVTAKIDKGEANPAKVKAGQAKVLAYMKKYRSITRLQGSAAFDRLSPEVQADVIWFDGVMADLMGLLDKGRWVESAARLDPRKKPGEVLEAIEKARKQWSFKGLGTVVKQLEKGIDTWKDGGAGLTVLPMAILLFIFWTMTKELLSRRPKK